MWVVGCFSAGQGWVWVATLRAPPSVQGPPPVRPVASAHVPREKVHTRQPLAGALPTPAPHRPTLRRPRKSRAETQVHHRHATHLSRAAHSLWEARA